MEGFVKVLNNENFYDFIEKCDLPVIVDFYAEWCGPCKMQAPILEKFAENNLNKVIVAKINTDNCREICIKFGIMSIPTLIMFNKSEIIGKKVGLTEESELLKMLADVQ